MSLHSSLIYREWNSKPKLGGDGSCLELPNLGVCLMAGKSNVGLLKPCGVDKARGFAHIAVLVLFCLLFLYFMIGNDAFFCFQHFLMLFLAAFLIVYLCF